MQEHASIFHLHNGGNIVHPRHGSGRQRKRIRGSGSTAVMALEVAGTVAEALLATQQRSG